MYKIGQCRPLACVQGIGCMQSQKMCSAAKNLAASYVLQQQHSCCSQRYAALGQCPDQLGQLPSWPLHCSPARSRVGHCCVTPIRQPQRLQPLHNRHQHLTLSTIKHHHTQTAATDVCSLLGCQLSHHSSWITASDSKPSVPNKMAYLSQHGDLVGRQVSQGGGNAQFRRASQAAARRVLLIVPIGATEHRRADCVP